jgi:hypothetical protein
MQSIHLPMLNARYWSALCLASIFGANMGDLCARNLGLGHVAGLPFLAIALALVMIVERFDRMQPELLLDRHHHRENGRDKFCGLCCRRYEAAEAPGDGGAAHPSRCRRVAELEILLAASFGHERQRATGRPQLLDIHVHRGDAGNGHGRFLLPQHAPRRCQGVDAALPVVAVLLLVGWRGPLRWLPFYWATVVAIRAAGTALGDTLAGRNMLGLPLSTSATGVVFCSWPGKNPQNRRGRSRPSA